MVRTRSFKKVSNKLQYFGGYDRVDGEWYVKFLKTAAWLGEEKRTSLTHLILCRTHWV